MSVAGRVATLVAGLDPVVHRVEIAALSACRSVPDLEALAGWLTPEGQRVRLRLVRHGSGTFLVVSYDDGWTKTLSQA